MGKRDVNRKSLVDVRARLKEIEKEQAALHDEQRDLVDVAAQLCFANSKYAVGQRYTLGRGRARGGGPTQLRTVEVVGASASKWSRGEGFELRVVTIKKGSGEKGEVFNLSSYDWSNLTPAEAAS